MNVRAALAPLAWATTLLSAVAQAQVVPPAAAASAAPLLLQTDERPERREPVVLHTTIEDGGSKIDELIVRGEVQHLVVTPKVGTTKSYEIIVQRGGRTPPDSTGGATSAVGKRVWNVLAF